MTVVQNGDGDDPVVAKPVLRRIADAYDRTNVAYLFRLTQPLGVLLAAIGLVFAAIGLVITAWSVQVTLDELAENRKLRNLTSFASLTKTLNEARTVDAGKSATYESDKRNNEWKCTTGTRQLRARVGQIAALEHMNSLGIALPDIKADNVNLVVRRGRNSQTPGIELTGAQLISADLQNSNLRRARLNGAKLLNADLDRSCLDGATFISADLTDADAIKADFRGADFSDAVLVGARLRYSRFWNADFSGATLTDADITGAHLRGADNLTQAQLDQACANPKLQPPSVPRRLTWNTRECP